MDKQARRAYSRVGLSVVVYVLLTYVASFVCTFVMAAIDKGSLQSDVYYWVTAIIPQYVVAFPAAFLILYPLPKAKPEGQRLSVFKWIVFFVVCFGLSMIANLAGNKLMQIITSLTGIQFQAVVEDMLSSVSVLFNIIVVAILAPIFEELLFRKLIIDRLAPYGQKSAIIVSALLFGLLHGNLSQFIYALLLGIILGHIYCRTGKIRHTIAIHMGFNALAGVFTSWLVSHIDIEKLSNLQGTEDMMEYVSENLGYILLLLGYEFFFYASMLIAAILLIIFFRRECAKLKPEPLPVGETVKNATLSAGMIAVYVVLILQFALNILSYNNLV